MPRPPLLVPVREDAPLRCGKSQTCSVPVAFPIAVPWSPIPGDAPTGCPRLPPAESGGTVRVMSATPCLPHTGTPSSLSGGGAALLPARGRAVAPLVLQQSSLSMSLASRSRPPGGAPHSRAGAARGQARLGPALSPGVPGPGLVPTAGAASRGWRRAPAVRLAFSLPNLFVLLLGGGGVVASPPPRVPPRLAFRLRPPLAALPARPVRSVQPGVFLCFSPCHAALPLCSSLHEMELNNCTGAALSVPAICPCAEAPFLLWCF